MGSTFGGLEIGKRAILAQQTSLNTTGHNIANANTIGYTRQDAVMKATNPYAYPGLNNSTAPQSVGTGVEVSELRRIRDYFLDGQYRIAQQASGYWDAKANALTSIEGLFNEPSDSGLSMMLDRFWGSFQELAKNPDSLAFRTVVAAKGKAVADSIQAISRGITQIETDLTKDVSLKEAEINSAIKEVAALNKQISLLTATGQQPNDLLDKRDLIIDNLSKLVGVQATPSQNGMVDLKIGGVAIVDGMTTKTFSVNPQTGAAMVDGNAVTLDGGEIKGTLEMLSGTGSSSIPSLRRNLDLLAGAIASQMNSLQTSDDARNLDDIAAQTQVEKILFFVDKDDPTQPPRDAAHMMVNPQLLASPGKIATAKSDFAGDGSNAKAMADLQFQKITINGSQTTIGDFYLSIVGQLGLDVNGAIQASISSAAVAQQVDNRRQSISGVSLDEEMTNMVRFQQAYNAAAKYVSAVNDMLDKLINGL
ncbi:flagellar hook-associated protein FlgK [Neobacillus sp. NPDC093127]|uniref:flagellar hook-associated protein FlgK n=1 Tax=Neobacillus sp. NPDC093127 TaxID=3364296 RepID=UPI00381CBA95